MYVAIEPRNVESHISILEDQLAAVNGLKRSLRELYNNAVALAADESVTEINLDINRILIQLEYAEQQERWIREKIAILQYIADEGRELSEDLEETLRKVNIMLRQG